MLMRTLIVEVHISSVVARLVEVVFCGRHGNFDLVVLFLAAGILIMRWA